MTKVEIGLALAGLVFGSSLLGVIFGKIGDGILQKLKHKYDTEDKESDRLKHLENATKWLMYDRIRHLGLAYIKDSVIDFDDRRILKEMHTAYHDLGGNGDLDKLMEGVYALPLKGGKNETAR